MVRVKTKLKELRKKELIPLLAASAVLRNYELFDELIKTARNKRIPFKRIYEALLQNYLFAGYPSAISSLKRLKQFYPAKRLGKAADMNLYHFRNRGNINCKKVYGEKSEKLIKNVKSFSPDLAEWLVLEGYGKVLGRAGLSFKERELCIVSILAALGFEDQLYSHLNGALRAKASIAEIRKVLENLSFIGQSGITQFGLNVLKRFEESKGMRS